MSVRVRLLLLPPADAEEHETLVSAGRAAVTAAGHALDLLEDLDPDDLAHALLQARRESALTVIGGAGLADGSGPAASAARAALDAGRASLDLAFPGLLDVARGLWMDEVGAEAALVDATFGRVGDGMLLVLPGSPDLLSTVLTDLALPLADRLLGGAAPASTTPDASAEAPSGDVDEAPASRGIEVSTMDGDTVAEAPEEAPAASGWKAALEALGGTLDIDGWPRLPEAFERIAPAREVLDNAGERGVVTLEDGTKLAAFGFPDLRRGRSKVILVGDGEPLCRVQALHRHPRPVGLTVHGSAGAPLPSADLDPDPVALERTGAVYPGFGTLFAVEGDRVYVLRSGRVWSWDGSKERDEGTDKQVLASLLLRWSQR